MVAKRRFLFLQGPCTPFYARLVDRLHADGHAVCKIHFNAGDAVYLSGGDSIAFRDAPDHLKDFLDRIYRDLGITDQILFGDQRPVHRPAVAHGEVFGVRTHVFEEGYFRPYWVTLEREGVNGHSLLPRDPDWFRVTGERLPAAPEPAPFHAPFRVRALHDVAYHLAGLANPLLFPGYRTHAPIIAPVEYAGYLKRFSWLKMIRRREFSRMQSLAASGRPYFVLPLQLNTDAQIRDHSRFEHMEEVIDYVLESFSRHGPNDAVMAIKNHPLDMGLSDFAGEIRKCARRYGLTGRVEYFEDGDLALLLRQAKGVVTVNSTVGMLALEMGIPTVTLSDPIYNLPGLTFQGSLDGFWPACDQPDRALFEAFRKVVMHATQVNGGFYCRRGMALAAENASRVLTADVSPLEALL